MLKNNIGKWFYPPNQQAFTTIYFQREPRIFVQQRFKGYQIHNEDNMYFYTFEFNDGEVLVSKFFKQECNIINNKLVVCPGCGCYPTEKGNCKWGVCKEKTKTLENSEFYKLFHNKKYQLVDEKKPISSEYKYLSSQCYYCDNCKYVNWHYLNYCYKCGGKFKNWKGNRLDFTKIFEGYLTGY